MLMFKSFIFHANNRAVFPNNVFDQRISVPYKHIWGHNHKTVFTLYSYAHRCWTFQICFSLTSFSPSCSLYYNFVLLFQVLCTTVIVSLSQQFSSTLHQIQEAQQGINAAISVMQDSIIELQVVLNSLRIAVFLRHVTVSDSRPYD
jgi:hypothetical protein